jgi:hypothetical protein
MNYIFEFLDLSVLELGLTCDLAKGFLKLNTLASCMSASFAFNASQCSLQSTIVSNIIALGTQLGARLPARGLSDLIAPLGDRLSLWSVSVCRLLIETIDLSAHPFAFEDRKTSCPNQRLSDWSLHLAQQQRWIHSVIFRFAADSSVSYLTKRSRISVSPLTVSSSRAKLL